MTIDKLIANTQRLDIVQAVADSMDATRADLVRLQRWQMLHGLRSDGSRIGKYRNKYYAAQKYALNSLAGLGYIDLKLEGYFQGDAFVDIRDGSQTVVFTSMDPKTESLVERYGETIFGLNEENASDYSINSLQPEAVKRIKQNILK